MQYIKFHEIDENPETNEHLAEILKSIKANGWVGLPLLAVDDQLLNGCHRATACEILEIEPEIYEIDSKYYESGDEDMDEYVSWLWWDVGHSDTQGVLTALEKLNELGLVDDRAVEIMRAEYEHEIEDKRNM